MRSFIVLLICTLSLFSTAWAQTLSEQDIEVRAREVGRLLRCVVCQNQSIDESDAALAGDMRKLVRAQIRNGKSNEEVLDFMQNRYGDYVLLKPPVQSNTYILWFTPFAILLAFILWYMIAQKRRPQSVAPKPLSDLERKNLAALTTAENEDRAS